MDAIALLNRVIDLLGVLTKGLETGRTDYSEEIVAANVEIKALRESAVLYDKADQDELDALVPLKEDGDGSS